jgi:hypothetical protein
MAEPVRARRLSDQEGQRLQQIVRRGKHASVRVRRALIVMASASGAGGGDRAAGGSGRGHATAAVHVTSILRKLGVTNRVQAAALAERASLLEGQQH